MPVAELVEAVVVKHAETHPAWGHRKVWAMTRFDGHQVSPATVLRIMRRPGYCWKPPTSASADSSPPRARPRS